VSPATAAINTPNKIHSLISRNGSSWNKERKVGNERRRLRSDKDVKVASGEDVRTELVDSVRDISSCAVSARIP
jgi:hypothetical protein